MPSVLSADALSTLPNLKESVGIATADTSNDNKLERVINRVTQWIEGETQRKLKARNYNGFGTAFEHKTSGSGDTVPSEDYLRFGGQDAVRDEKTGQAKVYLPQFPILKVNGSTRSLINHPNAVTFKLEVLDARGSDAGETWSEILELDDFVLDYATGALTLLGSCFVPGVQNYRVTCTAGYSTESAQPYVPADLEDLCVELAKASYREDRDVTAESVGTVSRSYEKGGGELGESMRATLSRYATPSL